MNLPYRKHRRLAAVLGLAAVSGLATAAAAQDSHAIEADNGTITVPADPQRIVTIGNTSQPFVDLGGRPVGASSYYAFDLLPEDQQAVFEAATALTDEEVDLELVASLAPDLILVQMDDAGFEAIEAELQAIAPTVFWSLDTEWKEFSDEIAVAANLTEGLEAMRSEFNDRVASLQANHGALIAGTAFIDISRGTWSDPGTFYIADIGCSEIARDDVGLNLPEAAPGADPLAYESLSYEQIAMLADYDVITYPVDAAGQPTAPFAEMMATNSWQALPAVAEGRAIGLFCPGNNSYGQVNRYLASLEAALAMLAPAD